MRPRTAFTVALVLIASACAGGSGDDVDPQLGGDTTREVTGRNAFSFPAAELTNEERRVFEIGDSFFTQNWVTAPASTDARDGLGPMMNAQACSSCHLLDGRGVPASTGDGELGLLLRLSVAETDGVSGPTPHEVYGDQLQDRAILGVEAEGEVVISYSEQVGEYADGTEYSLRAPTYTIESPAYGPLGDDLLVSPRLAPQVIGVGLLEAIPEDDILAAADPEDADGDGISGRANRAWNPSTEELELGRFGWKANVPTVEAQVVGAFNGDIGITSEPLPDDACTPTQTACLDAPDGGDPELTDSRLGSVTFYSRTLAVPAMRDADTDEVRDGVALFDDFGCATCHTPTQETGPIADVGVEALSDQTFSPYTDLLLHDMGEGLADGRPDFDASGSEWRTPPLWGIGLILDVNGERFLLHDGRARTIEEAILWHGGEAEDAAERFRTADLDDRTALIAFLEAL
ncbi:di-heme oxidoreductase family protein [Ilumatobacter nonamiensis]|uniref:di-heme oxidoreductase family protein n=1 Tax=Ilumatobacter nonamiensis TaxID=467093 RepID=UPI00058DCC70|nr:di-heme oxidoredictase family protein [Ilumatobacter nonamiensis]